ncbi:MAG TPA: HAD family hydrolase [Deltaproteobacteria bacterium]|nr:HAD family hydrolase [Deltaproteobacteria bacterium]
MGRRLSISFDLDGTLTTHSFVNSVWHDGLPRYISRHRGIELSMAKGLCMDAYDAVGESSIQWYQLPYWLDYFGLKEVSPEQLVTEYTSRVALFDDVIPSLDQLRKTGHTLIMFSNASRDFLDIEVSCGNLAGYFHEIISVCDDWGTIKSDASAYERLKSLVKGDVVHVGDHITFDYEVPKSVGIEAYHIWRGSGPRMKDSHTDLQEVSRRILCDKE